MAGKRGGKKGKKAAKKKDKRREEEDGETTEELSELDKHYYLNQIQALERKSERTAARCEQLETAEHHAREQYQVLLQDKSDITAFLKDRLSSRGDEAEELKSRLAGVVKLKEAEKEKYEERLATLRRDAENTRLDLSDQIIALTRKLESLEEFRQHKEELEAKLKGLEDDLTEERQQNKEKVSVLERASLVERAALRSELEERVARITEDLRRAAQSEVHSTTRRALHENETLSYHIGSMRERITFLRKDNQQLQESLTDAQLQKAVLQDTLSRVTATGERRARLLQEVTARAEQHSRVYRDYDRLIQENERQRRDLQNQQIQLDSATRLTCELRERLSEKNLALESTAARLREEDVAKRHIGEAVKAALGLLQDKIFSDSESTASSFPQGVMQQLVAILTEAENCLESPNIQEIKEPDAAKNVAAVAKGRRGDPLVTYHAGDLGLVPKEQGRRKVHQAQK